MVYEGKKEYFAQYLTNTKPLKFISNTATENPSLCR